MSRYELVELQVKRDALAKVMEWSLEKYDRARNEQRKAEWLRTMRRCYFLVEAIDRELGPYEVIKLVGSA